jgi:hypothetical protein
MTEARDRHITNLAWSPSPYLHGSLPARFIVATATPDDYRDDELALLGEFGRIRHENHIKNYGPRLDWGTNFICLGRFTEFCDERIMWTRKRNSWTGSEWSPSLPEAIGKFWGDQYTRDATGDVVMLTSGEIAVIEGKAKAEFKAPHYYDFRARILATGEVRDIARADPVIIADTIEALGDQMRMAIEHRIASVSRPDPIDVAASRAAVTTTNDPAALTHMWTARVWSFSEGGLHRVRAIEA